jgi:F-type H+-transporting ATPase subunit a
MITTNLREQNTHTELKTEAVSVVDQTHAETEVHTGPHIPAIQWETVYGIISNTTITTLVLLFIVSIVSFFANRALKSSKKSRLKLFFLNYIKFFDNYLRESLGDKVFARKYFMLVVGIFSVVFFGNLLGLIVDWFGASVSPTVLHYMRPMHSDLNTTAVLALITVIMMLFVSVKTHGSFSTIKSYVFNFHWHSLIEKCVNVFVGWLHFIWLWATFASLSLRLFGNIFAGVVLLWVITYLWGLATTSVFEVGKLLSLPFWFFEVGVALIQAIVFAGLMIAYLNSAKSHH